MSSKIEAMILSPDCQYYHPYFYSHPWALRCELGRGDTSEAYYAAARQRAEAIYSILFPHGADAMIFNYWVYDWSDSGEAQAGDYKDPAEYVAYQVEKEARSLRFLLSSMMKYRHVSVKKLKTCLEPDDPDFDDVRRDRIVCYADGPGFDDKGLLWAQIESENNSEVSLVSFENECILSVYDDRGCDVVFADPEHMRAFYPLLRPYFLEYDLKEMARRYAEAGGS